MLCVAITPSTPQDIFSSDLNSADCVEVRLDYLNNPTQSIDISWSRIPLPVIVTCRRLEHGGRFNGTLEEERRILEAAIRNGASYVDVDYRDFYSIPGAKCIASYHDFHETPANIGERLHELCELPGNVAKVATTVRSWADNRRLLDLLSHNWTKPVIVVGMGAIGEITRLIGPSRGSFLTYAATDQPSAEVAAPGQVTAREMVETFRFRSIRRTTKLMGILGNPVEHSLSPLIHNRAFEAMGLDFVYLRLPAPDVRDFFENAHSIGIDGCSITIPHKTAAVPYLAEISRAAQDVGAVNTVVNRENKLFGDNTDVHGVRVALSSVNFSATGKRVVILGSGGAARAAVAALKEARQIIVLSRSQRLRSDWPANVQFDLLKTLKAYPCDLLINATPVGMRPKADASPIEGSIPANIVFDMVYTPAETRLLRDAKAQGKSVVAGTVMFVSQAARQFEIWTGRTPPPDLYTPEQLAS